MIAYVTILCNGEGRPFSREELHGTTAIEGDLLVGPVDPHKFPPQRDDSLTCQPKIMARLKNRYRTKRGQTDHMDLFDPEILSMNDRGFILRGFERREDEKGRVRLTMQAWRVRTSLW